MNEPTATFTGTVTVAEAKRLVAAAEARQRAETDERLWAYWRKDGWHHLWRLRGDDPATAEFRCYGDARWTLRSLTCGFTKHPGGWVRATPAEVNAIFPGECPEARPEPVVGQTYRHKDAPDAEPHKTGWGLLRYDGDKTWKYTTPDGIVGFDTGSGLHKLRTQDVNEGILVPYQPPVRVPKVGEWVQHKTEPWPKARQVRGYYEGSAYVAVTGLADIPLKCDLRPATDAEIAETKRIDVVDGLIVRHKTSGRVWRWHQNDRLWHNINDSYKSAYQLGGLTTDYYEVLNEFTIKGAR